MIIVDFKSMQIEKVEFRIVTSNKGIVRYILLKNSWCRISAFRKIKSGPSFDEPHILYWCRRPDSNRHVGLLRLILSQVRLPIPPLRHV